MKGVQSPITSRTDRKKLKNEYLIVILEGLNFMKEAIVSIFATLANAAGGEFKADLNPLFS